MKERQIWEPASFSDFLTFPWATSAPWSAESNKNDSEIRKFGDSFVIKFLVNDKLMGDKLIYQLYERSPETLPKFDGTKAEVQSQIDRHLMLLGGLVRKDWVVYNQSGQELMWPNGARATPINRDAHFLWQRAQKLRVQEICNAVFPESVHGFLSDNAQVVHILGMKLTTYDLDDIVDSAKLNVTGVANASVDVLEPYLGHKVFSEMLGTGRLMKIARPESSDKYIVKWKIRCMKPECRHQITIHTMSGCHKGAWCYVCDPKTGEYITDLRNNLAICKHCAS